MDGTGGDGGAKLGLWITLDANAVAGIVEAALREDAWWIAARTGRYAQGRTVWADCVRPRRSLPACLYEDSPIENLLRDGG